MSKEAADAMQKAISERLAKLAAETPVAVTFNVNTACAVKVAIRSTLERLYDNATDDDFSKNMKEALVLIQVALDNS